MQYHFARPLLGLRMQYHFAIRDDLGFGGKGKTPISKKIIFLLNITLWSADAKVKPAQLVIS